MNKKFICVLILVFAFAGICVAVSLAPNRQQFEEFVQEYQRTYSSSEEYEFRYQNFLQTLTRIENKQKISKSTVSYGITKYADWSEDELMAKKLPRNQISSGGLARSCLASGITAPGMDISAIPSYFNWTAKGVVTGVKDQGDCGSCWAFSTIGNIESQYAISGKPLTSFSEQMIVDCSTACCDVEGQTVCNQGCDGGWMWTALTDVMSWGGVETELQYPYTGVDGTCNKVNSNLYAAVKNYTCIGTDEDQVAAFLVANGPLAVALNADLVEDYTSGIIDPWWPSEECDPTTLDHAVLIVGFGVDESDIFGDTPYWIVKNSWGENWGEYGYFRIYRGAGVCGINNAVTSAILED